MTYIVAQSGGKEFKEIGTCNQTGNHAPKFRWPGPIRVLIHLICNHLGCTDSEMLLDPKKRPPTMELYKVFIKTVPWFPALYDASQLEAAKNKNYDGPLGLFRTGQGPEKVANRARYLFEIPGDKKSGKKRRRGVSSEHPDNPLGKRRPIYAAHGETISYRLKLGKTISQKEVSQWGGK